MLSGIDGYRWGYVGSGTAIRCGLWRSAGSCGHSEMPITGTKGPRNSGLFLWLDGMMTGRARANLRPNPLRLVTDHAGDQHALDIASLTGAADQVVHFGEGLKSVGWLGHARAYGAGAVCGSGLWRYNSIDTGEHCYASESKNHTPRNLSYPSRKIRIHEIRFSGHSDQGRCGPINSPRHRNGARTRHCRPRTQEVARAGARQVVHRIPSSLRTPRQNPQGAGCLGDSGLRGF